MEPIEIGHKIALGLAPDTALARVYAGDVQAVNEWARSNNPAQQERRRQHHERLHRHPGPTQRQVRHPYRRVGGMDQRASVRQRHPQLQGGVRRQDGDRPH